MGWWEVLERLEGLKEARDGWTSGGSVRSQRWMDQRDRRDRMEGRDGRPSGYAGGSQRYWMKPVMKGQLEWTSGLNE